MRKHQLLKAFLTSGSLILAGCTQQTNVEDQLTESEQINLALSKTTCGKAVSDADLEEIAKAFAKKMQPIAHDIGNNDQPEFINALLENDPEIDADTIDIILKAAFATHIELASYPIATCSLEYDRHPIKLLKDLEVNTFIQRFLSPEMSLDQIDSRLTRATQEDKNEFGALIQSLNSSVKDIEDDNIFTAEESLYSKILIDIHSRSSQFGKTPKEPLAFIAKTILEKNNIEANDENIKVIATQISAIASVAELIENSNEEELSLLQLQNTL